MQKTIIGRVEKLHFPVLDIGDIYARIDTGAKTSAISARGTVLEDGRLKVELLFADKTFYADDYTTTVVASSNGHREKRYIVKLLVVIAERKIRARFSIADRTTQVYPVLIGRNILTKKFIVDVERGDPNIDMEMRRTKALRQQLSKEAQE